MAHELLGVRPDKAVLEVRRAVVLPRHCLLLGGCAPTTRSNVASRDRARECGGGGVPVPVLAQSATCFVVLACQVLYAVYPFVRGAVLCEQTYADVRARAREVQALAASIKEVRACVLLLE